MYEIYELTNSGNSGKTRRETFLDQFFALDSDSKVYFDPKLRLGSVFDVC